MPHDKNQNPIQPGDEVIIRASVSSVTQEESYCNVTVVTQEGMPPSGDKSTITLNAAQVEMVFPAETAKDSNPTQSQAPEAAAGG
jgi:hypothetical protein